MSAPYFSAYLNDTLLSDKLIPSVRVERSVEEDDMLEVVLAPETVQELDVLNPLIGDKLQVIYGYRGGEVSVFEGVISDIATIYADRITCTLRVLDTGNVMKKTSSVKVWKNISTKGIIQTIANFYGLEVSCELVGRTWGSYPQGGLSDFDFIKVLLQKDGAGDYFSYVSGNTLYVEKKALTEDSKLTFSLTDRVNVIFFKPAKQSSTTKKSGIKTTSVAVNPDTKEVISQSSERADTDALGGFVNTFDAFGNKVIPAIKDAVVGAENSLGAILPTPETDAESVKSKAKAETKNGGLNEELSELEIVFTPNLLPNTVITIGGVRKLHAGNYLIVKVTDDITSSGAVTSLSLKRNASKIGTTQPTGAKNNTVGANSSEPKKVQLNLFDANGNKLQ